MDTLRITGTGESDPRIQRARTLLTTGALVAVMMAPLPLWFLQVPWWVLLLPPLAILGVLFVALAVLTSSARRRELVLLGIGADAVVVSGHRIAWPSVTGAAVVLHGAEREQAVTSEVLVRTRDGRYLARLPARPGSQVRDIHRDLRRRLKPHGVRVGWQPGPETRR